MTDLAEEREVRLPRWAESRKAWWVTRLRKGTTFLANPNKMLRRRIMCSFTHYLGEPKYLGKPE